VWSATKRLLQLLSATVVPVYLGGVPRRHIFEPLKPNRSRTLAMAKLVEEGVFKAVIDSTFKFANALDAYDRILSRQVIGKVVVEVNDLE
jgi:NADPH:quinone reductase-like Zn-dependent oxidoreductase